MKNNKKSFILYYDTIEILDDLTDEEAGKIFKAVKAFEMTGEVVELEKGMRRVFLPFKHALIRAREKWQEKCDKNRRNILKRWAKKNGKILPDKPLTDVYDRIPSIPMYTKHTDSDSDREREPERVPLEKGKDTFELAKQVFDEDLKT